MNNSIDNPAQEKQIETPQDVDLDSAAIASEAAAVERPGFLTVMDDRLKANMRRQLEEQLGTKVSESVSVIGVTPFTVDC